jgi:hypothetical protein
VPGVGRLGGQTRWRPRGPLSVTTVRTGRTPPHGELVKLRGGTPDPDPSKAVPLVVSVTMVPGDFALVRLARSRLEQNSAIQSGVVLCTAAGHCMYPPSRTLAQQRPHPRATPGSAPAPPQRPSKAQPAPKQLPSPTLPQKDGLALKNERQPNVALLSNPEQTHNTTARGRGNISKTTPVGGCRLILSTNDFRPPGLVLLSCHLTWSGCSDLYQFDKLG